MTPFDKIELKFQFIEIPKEQRSQYNTFHSQLALKFSLNGQEFNTPIDNYVLIDSINDHRWGDNNEYSEFYIITCSCGVPAFDIHPCLKEGDSCYQTCMPARENVFCTIYVSVMCSSTNTFPFSYS